MRRILVFFMLLLASCNSSNETKRELWVSKPLSQWPNIALTNEISFTDTTYSNIANSFLIDTGYDTLAVSCKHIFMLFQYQLGYKNIDLGSDFYYWKMYPKNDKSKMLTVKRLINKNPQEIIGEFNTLKLRDWILFDVESKNKELYPLKIRYNPVKKNEVVYAIGWGANQPKEREASLVKMQCIDNVGDYFYTITLSENVNAHGRSGSPVIDKNGYLVGIVSGQEGTMGVMGGVRYLESQFEKYNIKYRDTEK